MKVLDRQQLRLALLEPLGARLALTFRAMSVAARVVADANVVALAALFDVAAQGRSPAGLDGLHQFELMQRESMHLPVILAVLSKNAGQLQSGPSHGGLGFRLSGFGFAMRRANRLTIQPVQRADGRGDYLRRNSGIACGGVNLTMPEQDLDDAEIRAVLQQMCGE